MLYQYIASNKVNLFSTVNFNNIKLFLSCICWNIKKFICTRKFLYRWDNNYNACYELKLVSYLGSVGLSPVTNLLPPITINTRNQTSSNTTSSTQVGSTWAGSGLNIDLDNIMGSKTKQTGPAPTMNQLASNSPQHQIKIGRK